MCSRMAPCYARRIRYTVASASVGVPGHEWVPGRWFSYIHASSTTPFYGELTQPRLTHGVQRASGSNDGCNVLQYRCTAGSQPTTWPEREGGCNTPDIESLDARGVACSI